MPKRNNGARLKWRNDRKLYEIQWFENGKRKRLSTGYDDLTQANQFLAQFIKQQEEEQQITSPLDPSQVPIADILQNYYKEKQNIASSETIYFGIKKLLEFWQNSDCSQINQANCQKYCEESSGAKSTTNKRRLGILSASVNLAYKQGILNRPIYVWQPANTTVKKDRWLTRHEAAKLLYFANGFHTKLFILIGLYTGARKQAILDLKWSQIDMINKRINFNTIDRLSSNKKRSLIPIPNKLYTILSRINHNDDEHVIIFKGKALADIKKSFNSACQKAGLDDVTPHTLRHTCATWLTQKGVSFHKIALYIGHSNSRTPENIYAHHAPDYLNDVIDRL